MREIFCNCLNDFFCNTSSDLSASFKCNTNDFAQYCNNNSCSSMFCETVTIIGEIHNIVALPGLTILVLN